MEQQTKSSIELSLSPGESELVDQAFSRADSTDLPRRVWAKDYTLWSDSPEEITNRLGWLTVTDEMLPQVAALGEFADKVLDAGIESAVLLGMGGSSLAPLVISSSFERGERGLPLTVLDSTHPNAVAAVADGVDLEKTLFIVSSKSGGTLETFELYKYFAGKGVPNSHFVAVTDPRSELAELGESFMQTFLNPADIGGRYSALSYFGLVPAALHGIDLKQLLDSAWAAEAESRAAVPAAETAALRIGLVVGALAKSGRDKLTFFCNEPLGTLGLWLEQLVAESSGKSGRGIVPVAGEPALAVEEYGPDRIFAYIRNQASPDSESDAHLEKLAAAGHPVITLSFNDVYDLGYQFFTWEFAIAVACAEIGVHAFNQPNVQEAKDLTKAVINAYQKDGGFQSLGNKVTQGALTSYSDEVSVEAALAKLFGSIKRGSYFDLMAYTAPSESSATAINSIRQAVAQKLGVATTFGFGPRFLHSTGQLHKGGPPEGVFLQLLTTDGPTLELPEGYDFKALITAQAAGDLQALTKRNLPVLRIDLSGDVGQALAELNTLVKSALCKVKT